MAERYRLSLPTSERRPMLSQAFRPHWRVQPFSLLVFPSQSDIATLGPAAPDTNTCAVFRDPSGSTSGSPSARQNAVPPYNHQRAQESVVLR
jgi:hypothetical protein